MVTLIRTWLGNVVGWVRRHRRPFRVVYCVGVSGLAEHWTERTGRGSKTEAKARGGTCFSFRGSSGIPTLGSSDNLQVPRQGLVRDLGCQVGTMQWPKQRCFRPSAIDSVRLRIASMVHCNDRLAVGRGKNRARGAHRCDNRRPKQVPREKNQWEGTMRAWTGNDRFMSNHLLPANITSVPPSLCHYRSEALQGHIRAISRHSFVQSIEYYTCSYCKTPGCKVGKDTHTVKNAVRPVGLLAEKSLLKVSLLHHYDHSSHCHNDGQMHSLSPSWSTKAVRCSVRHDMLETFESNEATLYKGKRG
ncbi:hypothetical protein GE21DRAFT_1269284 [Neurospora crassa]|nr:hypothetical protein GE21DRAFT_1269284 [Neurospora crassa]